MSGKLMGSLRSRNISHIITERIAESILAGDLMPGQRLPTEEEFASRIGAGKSSVREAIKILEAMGVLEIRRGDGTYVVDEFTGSMLDPMVYGILLAEKNGADVIDFKVGVQRLAADDLLAQGVSGRLAGVRRSLEGAEGDDATAALLASEQALASEVANPLVGELYRQAVRIAAHCQRPFAEQLVPWLQAYVDALEAGDESRVHELLAQERAILAS